MWLPVPDTEMVESFRELYEREFGERPSVEDAREAATRLLIFCAVRESVAAASGGAEAAA